MSSLVEVKTTRFINMIAFDILFMFCHSISEGPWNQSNVFTVGEFIVVFLSSITVVNTVWSCTVNRILNFMFEACNLSSQFPSGWKRVGTASCGTPPTFLVLRNLSTLLILYRADMHNKLLRFDGCLSAAMRGASNTYFNSGFLNIMDL